MAQILLIEPNVVVARYYREALMNAGHDVCWCQNAQHAIFCADEVKPDVVLLELQLNGHNGAEFLYEFRSYPDWQDTPVIVVSMVAPNNYAMGDYVCEQMYIVAHHYKPRTKLSDLVRSINRALAVTI